LFDLLLEIFEPPNAQEEIEARFAADPWTPMKLLRLVSIEPWEILLRARA